VKKILEGSRIYLNAIERYKNQFLLKVKEKGRHESTIKRYLFDLNDFLLWYQIEQDLSNNSLSISSVTMQNYFTFLQSEREYSLASLKRIRTVLNQFMKFLISINLINQNPMNNINVLNDGVNGLREQDFVSNQEFNRLLDSVMSYRGLSDKQIPAHEFLRIRNNTILLIIFKYGLTLKEITNLKINSVDFYHNTLQVESESSMSRAISLDIEGKRMLYQYLTSIPNPTRPGQNPTDPFFIAFDFARNTYRWDYDGNIPKKLTDIAIQKMIRIELARAGLRSEITLQHLRRTSILNALKSEKSYEDIISFYGFKANNSLKRYISFLNDITSK
jgi:site-specific recombinase XerD